MFIIPVLFLQEIWVLEERSFAQNWLNISASFFGLQREFWMPAETELLSESFWGIIWFSQSYLRNSLQK